MIWLLACTGSEPADTGSDRAPLQTLDTAHALALQFTERWPAETLAFDWIQTVFAWGVYRTWVKTGDPALWDYLVAWQQDEVDAYADGAGFVSSDSMSPALLASVLMDEDPSLGLEPVLDAAWAYLDVVPTLSNGAWAHWGHDNAYGMPSDQVWIDSHFMLGMFLLAEGERSGNASGFSEQYAAWSELCRHESDLYFHAWDEAAGATIPTDEVFWSRGNSWVAVAAVEAELVGEPVDGLDEHLAALVATQADDGLFKTVLNDPHDDPDNYTETSGAALIGAALARRGGYDALPAIVDGVLGRLEETDGVWELEGTSYGTNPSDYDGYVAVPVADDLMTGVGAVLMLLADADGL